MDDRKLAGILVELTGKTGDAAQLVMGIGINLRMRPAAGEGITQQWVNLQESGISIDRNLLAATLVKELCGALEIFEQGGLSSFIPRWQALDNYFNRPVRLIIGEREIHGIDRGIDNQGALLWKKTARLKRISAEKFLCVESDARGK